MAATLTAEDVLTALSPLQPVEPRELGSGTFGTTWSVELSLDPQKGRQLVAVKFIDPRLGRPWDIDREIRGLQSVEHENILTLHDAMAVDIRGEHFFALICEYMAGGDLAHYLDAYGPPLLQEQYTLAEGLASGLQALHQAGRFHRDMKPLNILLRDTTLRSPVIGDFGQSRGVDDDTLTLPGQQLGTVAFRAPEIVDDRSDFMQADVWSLGAVLHCVATNEVPAKRRGRVDVSERLGSLPAWYRELIESMVHQMPGFRPSMRAVVRRLHSGMTEKVEEL